MKDAVKMMAVLGSYSTSKMLLVIGNSPRWAGDLGSSSRILGLIGPVSKTDVARSPAAVRWKGLAVNSAARGDIKAGVGGTGLTV